MITKYLEVGENDWGVLINYEYDSEDSYDIAAVLHSFGLSERSINKALKVLSHVNTGMAVSNDSLRMTTIYVSKATSASEFWSTLDHELYHATSSIIDFYG
jgi:hypothetical protein